jgi:hypothetical protein
MAPKGQIITVKGVPAGCHINLGATYRIRLLSWMAGVKANSGVRVKNTWPRDPPINQDLHPHPRQAMSLASMDQSGPPKQDNPIAKHGQTIGISWYRRGS